MILWKSSCPGALDTLLFIVLIFIDLSSMSSVEEHYALISEKQYLHIPTYIALREKAVLNISRLLSPKRFSCYLSVSCKTASKNRWNCHHVDIVGVLIDLRQGHVMCGFLFVCFFLLTYKV